LLIEPIDRADAAALAAVVSDLALYGFIGGEPPSAAALDERIDGWLAGSRNAGETWHNWTLRLTAEEVIGHLQATVTDDGAAADIAWMVGTPWQRRGYASEAASELVRWLESIGVRRITAHIHPDHAASARVAERAGLAPTERIEDGEVVWRRTTEGAEN
jgi:RimJ/RimL family protein N-acetyltransferase